MFCYFLHFPICSIRSYHTINNNNARPEYYRAIKIKKIIIIIVRIKQGRVDLRFFFQVSDKQQHLLLLLQYIHIPNVTNDI